MSKSILLIALFLVCHQSISGQRVRIPDNYVVVDSVKGDLDKDGIEELVVVYNTLRVQDETINVPRKLVIYKKQDKDWEFWVNSDQAVYGSREGGMMGDPFESIKIKGGSLFVSQNGGSSWTWGHTDKYRYLDGKFYLIGFSGHYGKICEYWEDVDFNLPSGKMTVKKEYERCNNGDEQKVVKQENETFIKKGIKITLENRSEKELMIETPRYGNQIYVTTGSY